MQTLTVKNNDCKIAWQNNRIIVFLAICKEKDFCVASGDVFIAPYTGTYYAYVRNYYGKQYKYEIGVKNKSEGSDRICFCRKEQCKSKLVESK